MSEHHPLFSPSGGLPRALLCPGSPWLVEKLRGAGLVTDDAASPAAAAEGTLLHSRIHPEAPLDDLTGEQAAMVERVREVVREETRGAREIIYETTVMVLDEDGNVLTFGTLDVAAVWEKPDVPAKLIDAKFGRAEPSPTFLSVQGASYSQGVMPIFERDAVDFVSVHPRLELVHREEHRGFRELTARIRGIIEHSKANRGLFHPSAEACAFCPALGFCRHAAREVAHALEETLPLERTTPEVLARELEVAKLAVPWAEARKDRAIELIRAGARIPGWGFVEKAGRRVVVDPPAALERLVDVLGPDGVRACTQVSVGNLEEEFKSRMVAKRGGTKKAAGEEFTRRLDGIVSRGAPTVSLVRVHE